VSPSVVPASWPVERDIARDCILGSRCRIRFRFRVFWGSLHGRYFSLFGLRVRRCGIYLERRGDGIIGLYGNLDSGISLDRFRGGRHSCFGSLVAYRRYRWMPCNWDKYSGLSGTMSRLILQG
jgi:hypothetical protein